MTPEEIYRQAQIRIPKKLELLFALFAAFFFLFLVTAGEIQRRRNISRLRNELNTGADDLKRDGAVVAQARFSSADAPNSCPHVWGLARRNSDVALPKMLSLEL